MNSYNIWIPSIQDNLRFRELTWNQLRHFVKTFQEPNLDFLYHINKLLEANIISPFNINSLTTLDRFVIFVYLKIHSCNNIINLSTKCEHCETATKIQINMGNLLNDLAPKVDRSFKTVLDYKQFKVFCDIPSIGTEYEIYRNNLEMNSMENSNNYVISHINDVRVGDVRIDLMNLTIDDRLKVLNSLPAALYNKIYFDFLSGIHKSIAEIKVIDVVCSNKKCAKVFELKFDFSNINDLIKIIYKDYSLEGLYSDLVLISTKAHIDASFVAGIAPFEVDILTDICKRLDAAQEEEKQQGPTDMFDQYRIETKGMQESSSEFGGI